MTRRKSLFSVGTLGFAVAFAGVFVAAPVLAQGSLSTQGFGYPPGQMSTRALGTGGAVAEFDSRSALNPAALAIGATGEVFAQYDPEIRSVSGPAGTSKSTTARFPVIGATLPLLGGFVLGISATSFLDRTWQTSATREQTIGDETTASTETLKSNGGITDLQYGLAYSFGRYLQVGVAGHYYSGSNTSSLLQQFGDSLRFGNVTQSTSLNFGGQAVSAGVVLSVLPSVSLAVSGRKGETIRMSADDTLLTQAHIPDHYAAALSFNGIPGTIIAARYAQDDWSSLTPLSTSGAVGVDAKEYNIGLESAGPHSAGRSLIVRLGARWRTLPFEADGNIVHEFSFGGGLGIPIAPQHATFDISVLRSNRTGVPDITEHAYNLSFGLRVEP